MQHQFALNKHLLKKVRQSISNNSKVLILGATGWLGQTATFLFHELSIPSLLVSSKEQNFKIGNQSFETNTWNLEKISRFEPTIVVDAAYKTREFSITETLQNYISTNRMLVENSLALRQIDSIDRFISFSSGAASIYKNQLSVKSIESDPYGYLKLEAERILSDGFGDAGINFVIPRIWSISGSLVTKVNGFALSDLICQSINGDIKVDSLGPVRRRYCLAEEVIGTSLLTETFLNKIYDSGGDLIEVHELARIINNLSGSNSEIKSPDKSLLSNDYFSDNADWEKVCKEISYNSASLDEQVLQVYEWLKEFDKCN